MSGDFVGSTPETPLVPPRRLQWFHPGDSGGSTQRLWSPSEFLGPMEIDFNNLFKKVFYHIMGGIMLCAYYKSMKMCIFEVVSHSVDIVNYLASMWHVFSTKSQFSKLFYYSCFGSCL
jgi:hypothetical protein